MSNSAGFNISSFIASVASAMCAGWYAKDHDPKFVYLCTFFGLSSIRWAIQGIKK